MRSVLLAFCSSALLLTPLAVAQDSQPAAPTTAEKQESKWMRVTRTDAGKPNKLQTSVVRFRKGDQVIDLIGAIHIADRTYFQKLQQLFATYDVLAFELANDEDVRPSPAQQAAGRRSSHPIGNMQNVMADALGLVHQMQNVDYTPDNFVHADVGLQTAMAMRGETQMTILLDVVRNMLVQQNLAAAAQANGQEAKVDPAQKALQGVDLQEMLMLYLMDRPAFTKKARRIAAEIFAAQGVENGLGVMSLNGVIVDARNEAAMKVVDREIAKPGVKTLGLFYGAAHNPDFEKRLIARGFKQEGKPQWITAWDVSNPAGAAQPKRQRKPDPQREMMHQILDALLDNLDGGR